MEVLEFFISHSPDQIARMGIGLAFAAIFIVALVVWVMTNYVFPALGRER